jgi:hypothetical protein
MDVADCTHMRVHVWEYTCYEDDALTMLGPDVGCVGRTVGDGVGVVVGWRQDDRPR